MHKILFCFYESSFIIQNEFLIRWTKLGGYDVVLIKYKMVGIIFLFPIVDILTNID